MNSEEEDVTAKWEITGLLDDIQQDRRPIVAMILEWQNNSVRDENSFEAYLEMEPLATKEEISFFKNKDTANIRRNSGDSSKVVDDCFDKWSSIFDDIKDSGDKNLAVVMENCNLFEEQVSPVNKTFQTSGMLMLTKRVWELLENTSDVEVQPMLGPTCLVFYKDAVGDDETGSVSAETFHLKTTVPGEKITFEEILETYAPMLANEIDDLIYDKLYRHGFVKKVAFFLPYVLLIKGATVVNHDNEIHYRFHTRLGFFGE